jgi:hypothetical protein
MFEGVVFTDLVALVNFAKLRSLAWLYDGRVNHANMSNIRRCTHKFKVTPELGAIVMFTRDVGHHSGGWWKNPDYERCFHVSTSYRDIKTGDHVEHQKDVSERIAKAFYGADITLCWIEGPYSDEGKQADVWHYRLFCDPGWQAFKPKGEVYSKDWTPAHWRSFSDIHGYQPTEDQAPFLLASGDQA